MLFGGLGALGLVGPDEPRYAAIAREMAQTGDWVTPRLYGRPWLEKPVLYYWAAASAFRLFGVSEFAARLPGALGALLATLATAWAALRIFGIEAAWLTLLILPTTIGMFTFARGASPDMIFSASLALTAVAAAELLAKPRPGLLARLAFGVFLGAAALAKGPAAVILAAGAIFLWALGSRQWRAAAAFLASNERRRILRCHSAVVRPGHVTQSGILPRLFSGAQFPTIPHARISAPAAGLVPRRRPRSPGLSVDGIARSSGSGLGARHRRPYAVGIHPFCFLLAGRLSPVLFFSFSRSKLSGLRLAGCGATGVAGCRQHSATPGDRSKNRQDVDRCGGLHLYGAIACGWLLAAPLGRRAWGCGMERGEKSTRAGIDRRCGLRHPRAGTGRSSRDRHGGCVSRHPRNGRQRGTAAETGPFPFRASSGARYSRRDSQGAKSLCFSCGSFLEVRTRFLSSSRVDAMGAECCVSLLGVDRRGNSRRTVRAESALVRGHASCVRSLVAAPGVRLRSETALSDCPGRLARGHSQRRSAWATVGRVPQSTNSAGKKRRLGFHSRVFHRQASWRSRPA